LAARRGEPDVGTTAAWVATQQRQRAFIALRLGDGTIRVPTCQVTAGGDPRPELRPLLGVLLSRLDGWAAWTWLTAPSSYLSGDVPEEIATTEPARALRAAERFLADG